MLKEPSVVSSSSKTLSSVDHDVLLTTGLPITDSSSFSDVLKLLLQVREVCNEILINCAALEAESAQKKNEYLKQQLTELNEAAKEMAEANKGSKIGRIFGFLSVIISAVAVVLCPTPMTVAAFTATLGLVIDSEVAAHVDGYDGMLGSLSSKLMESMDGLPPALAAALTAVVMVAVVMAAIVIGAKGLGMMFPNMSGVGAQQALAKLLGPDNIANMNSAMEATRIVSQVLEIIMQVSSSVNGFQAAGFTRNADDLSSIIQFLESGSALLEKNSEDFKSISDTLSRLYDY